MRIKMQENEAVSYDMVYEEFIRKCRIKNLTEESIKSYDYKLRVFRRYLENKSIEFTGICRETIDDYILWERENSNVKDITINSYLRSIKALLYFAMEQGYISPFKIHMLKVDKPIKKTFSEAQLERLLKKPNMSTTTFSEFKIWAFCNVLLGTGIRLSTALDLRIKDLDFENSFILLHKNKSRKQTYIPMSKSLRDVLRLYLRHRRGQPDDYVFCNSYGDKGDKRTFEDMLTRYCHKRDVYDPSNAHAFRHTFARLAVRNGIDAFRLQRLMTHASIITTQDYINLFAEDLSNEYEKFNPLDNLKFNKKRIDMGEK